MTSTHILISFRSCDEVNHNLQQEPSVLVVSIVAYVCHVHLHLWQFSLSQFYSMDQREILMQNLERVKSKKLNREEFTSEFLVSDPLQYLFLKLW